MKSIIFLIFILFSLNVSNAQPLCDFQGKDSLYVQVVGDTINVWNVAVCAYCARDFSISIYRSADSIYVIQTDTTGKIALCDCLYDLRASIVGLPRGKYWIVVYRDLLKKYAYPNDKHQVIGAIQLNYEPLGTSNLSSSNYQSGCYTTNVPQQNKIEPSQFTLFQNYPNPFNPSTTIQFQTTNSDYVVLKVFDLLGREIKTLLAEKTSCGLHSIEFDIGKDFCSGIYFYRMIVGSFSQTRMMVLSR